MSVSRPSDSVECMVHTVRERRVVLDVDVAELFGIEVASVVDAVKNNPSRFPEDFAFLLTREECSELKRDADVSGNEEGGAPPYAFTEQGIAMLAGLLNSERAIRASVEIVRTYVGIRKVLSTNHDIVQRLDAREKELDEGSRAVLDAIRQIMTPVESKRRRIGFVHSEERGSKS